MRRQLVATWVREHVLAVDTLLAAAGALVLAPATSSAGGGAWSFLLGLAVVGALALRRVQPVLCAAVVFLLALAHYLVGVPLLPCDVAVLVALYSVAAHGPGWARRLGLVLALVGAALEGLASASRAQGQGIGALVELVLGAGAVTTVFGAVVLVAWTAGQWRRTRIAYVGSLVDRASRAEREREQQGAIAAAAERARIARELHDIVAHSLSVIIAQADGGRYAAATSPSAAVGALETVASTGRTALTDMRRLLGVLREGDGAQLGPQPDAASVPELVDAVRESGLPVALVRTGDPRPLAGGAGLVVYRTVQEALTNVLKHGGPGVAAQVRLHWSPTALEVCVEDDGRGASAADDGAGRGLSGMRERLALYGGRVQAGPRPDGGFAVHAVLPVPAGTPLSTAVSTP